MHRFGNLSVGKIVKNAQIMKILKDAHKTKGGLENDEKKN